MLASARPYPSGSKVRVGCRCRLPRCPLRCLVDMAVSLRQQASTQRGARGKYAPPDLSGIGRLASREQAVSDGHPPDPPRRQRPYSDHIPTVEHQRTRKRAQLPTFTAKSFLRCDALSRDLRWGKSREYSARLSSTILPRAWLDRLCPDLASYGPSSTFACCCILQPAAVTYPVCSFVTLVLLCIPAALPGLTALAAFDRDASAASLRSPKFESDLGHD